jgi:hypothetical protein
MHHSAILRLWQDGAISHRKLSTMPTLTPEIIEAAIDGLEAKKQRIDVQIAELRAMLSPNGNGSAPAPQPTVRKKRGMSAAGRKAIAEAQRKRWAAAKGQSVNAEPTKKPKRKLSAAGRAAIVAALKKRWVLKRAAAEKPWSMRVRRATPKRPVARKAA